MVRLELVADRIKWVKTVANGKIDYFDLKSKDNGNSIEVKLITINTDDIEASFEIKLEKCGDVPIIEPKENKFSMQPNVPLTTLIKITANTEEPTTFDCLAVLYDSDLNKLD